MVLPIDLKKKEKRWEGVPQAIGKVVARARKQNKRDRANASLRMLLYIVEMGGPSTLIFF